MASAIVGAPKTSPHSAKPRLEVIAVDQHHYSVPHRFARREVEVLIATES
jgi:hypothetical protein